MRTVLFALAMAFTTCLYAGEAKSDWPIPIKVDVALISFDGCCLTFRVSLYQWVGENWQLLWDGRYSASIENNDCCPTKGMHDQGNNDEYYLAYMSDQDVKTATDEAVAEAVALFIASQKQSSTIMEMNAGKLVMFPNPADHELNLQFEAGLGFIDAHYQILDCTGHILDFGTFMIQKGSASVALRTLPDGIYFLRIFEIRGGDKGQSELIKQFEVKK